VSARASLAQLEPGNIHHFDTSLANLIDGVGIALVGHHARLQGRPQLAYETYGPRSAMRISTLSSRLSKRAAHNAPPIIPPTMMTFIKSFSSLFMWWWELCSQGSARGWNRPLNIPNLD
jgi:hypothetical protein